MSPKPPCCLIAAYHSRACAALLQQCRARALNNKSGAQTGSDAALMRGSMVATTFLTKQCAVLQPFNMDR